MTDLILIESLEEANERIAELERKLELMCKYIASHMVEDHEETEVYDIMQQFDY